MLHVYLNFYCYNAFKKRFVMSKLVLAVFILGLFWGLEAKEYKLFKSYTFGMPKSHIAKESGVFDCSQDFSTEALCVEDRSFLGAQAAFVFKFSNHKLVQVMLIMDYSEELYYKLFGTLYKKMALMAIENGSERLDLLKLYKEDRKNLKSKMTLFESEALKQGAISYIFLDKKVAKALRNRVNNVVDMVLKAPRDLREVDFSVSTDNEGQSYLSVVFSLPKLALNVISNKIQSAPDEDF